MGTPVWDSDPLLSELCVPETDGTRVFRTNDSTVAYRVRVVRRIGEQEGDRGRPSLKDQILYPGPTSE